MRLRRFLYISGLAVVVALSACGVSRNERQAEITAIAETKTAPATGAPSVAPPAQTPIATPPRIAPAPTVAETAAPIAEAPAAPEPLYAYGLPDGFVYVRDINPNIRAELRYATPDNFTGAIVDGYYSTDAAILTGTAARSLSDVQTALEREELGLLIYDAYRPQKASDFFVAWAKSDEKNDRDTVKETYYPNEEKSTLHKNGYIASHSKHASGDTVDLTLVDFVTGEPLDMGGHFDLLDPSSSHGAAGLTDEQTANRLKLKTMMAQAGFAAYSAEWWHYSYNAPTFAGRYFDFDVRGSAQKALTAQ